MQRRSFELRLLPVLLVACAASIAAQATEPLSAPARVGKQMFFDRSLSGSGKLACASCHDPDHAYGPPNALAVQPGGSKMTKAGTRAVPSLRYQEYTPPYADLLDNPDGISTPGPGGGLTLDGRAPTLADQARIPLLAGNEMANPNAGAVIAKIKASAYADEFRAAFGADVFGNVKMAFEKALAALQAFQQEDLSFHPYTSKYDLYASNKIGGNLTPTELRGFAVYNDPEKGNCFACHYNGAGIHGSVRLFTDFTYAAIGVPRNPDIPANRNPKYFDLGICSRADHPLPANNKYCGLFKTPTLRNVATRQVFFHNGQIKSLHDAIRFYNTRDTNPELWYPTVRGVVQKFNDLPPRYRGNIDPQAPLNGRPAGSAPPMSEQEMQDLEAFLNTLTDGYRPPAATQEAFSAAVTQYLQARGNLCLGKFDWPIAVSEEDRVNGTNNAIQMPVLEQLGLVASSVADGITRYELTEAGKKSYLSREATTTGLGGRLVVHHGDFCAAALSLSQVVKWDIPSDVDGHEQTTVTYTYKVAPADWARDARARQVFPMIDRIIQGENTLQLKQSFQWTGETWTAVYPTG